MVVVPEGEYWLGCDKAKNRDCINKDESPGHLVPLKRFAIMQTEVTVADYRACVKAGKCSKPGIPVDGKRELCTWGKTGGDRYPINCVTWEAANKYCAFRGGRLPTEAEWEAAARGPERPDFPWGSGTATCELTVITDDKGVGCGAKGPMPTGTKSKDSSWVKALDMAGNLREWTETDYAAFPNGGHADPHTAGKVTKGASFPMRYLPDSPVNTCHTRGADDPKVAFSDLGFRCVKSL